MSPGRSPRPPRTGNCLAPVPLFTASPFGDFRRHRRNDQHGILTVIHGDLGTIATANSSITGFHDVPGDIYTESGSNMGAVDGTIYTCTNSTTGPNSAGPSAPNCSIATQARLDAQTAYLALAAMPPGANPGGNLASLTPRSRRLYGARRIFHDSGRRSHSRCTGQCERGLRGPDVDPRSPWAAPERRPRKRSFSRAVPRPRTSSGRSAPPRPSCGRGWNHGGNHYFPGRSLLLDLRKCRGRDPERQGIVAGRPRSPWSSTVINVPAP